MPHARRGFTVTFTTAAALVGQFLAARDERLIVKLQRDLASVKLRIVDELGYVPLSSTGAELLFETSSLRHELGSTIVTSNLPFEDWSSVLGSEQLTGTLLDRLTCHVSILTMNGDSYRLKQSAARRPVTASGAEQNQATQTVDLETRAMIGLLIENAATDMEMAPIGAISMSAPQPSRWPAFTPPHWPAFAPPLTDGYETCLHHERGHDPSSFSVQTRFPTDNLNLSYVEFEIFAKKVVLG